VIEPSLWSAVCAAIQLMADERVQTKENMRRTCVLHTEYVGILDFKLDYDDFDFLWRKGCAPTTSHHLPPPPTTSHHLPRVTPASASHWVRDDGALA
jgi:hypothetical protein